MKSLRTIAITGGTGYIGRHLVRHFLKAGDVRVKILTRTMPVTGIYEDLGPNVEVTVGDLHHIGSLTRFLEPRCTVVHLAYLQSSGESENLSATSNLLAACNVAGVKRLIHCSTAAVVGQTKAHTVSETTPCLPTSNYGVTKLKIEDAIVAAQSDSLDVVILRPTAVFGEGGGSLKKLLSDLIAGKNVRNYLKSSLFGDRRMNLVYVENVVAAIGFMSSFPKNFCGGIYIISQDEDPRNNFADVEEFFRRTLSLQDYMLPKLPIPLTVLSWVLKFLNRNDADPTRNYDSGKLLSLGFVRPIDFPTGLKIYTDWYRQQHLER